MTESRRVRYANPGRFVKRFANVGLSQCNGTQRRWKSSSEKEMPIVIVDEEIEDVAGGVFVDNCHGGYLVAAHLLHLEHRDIAFIAGEAEES